MGLVQLLSLVISHYVLLCILISNFDVGTTFFFFFSFCWVWVLSLIHI